MSIQWERWGRVRREASWIRWIIFREEARCLERSKSLLGHVFIERAVDLPDCFFLAGWVTINQIMSNDSHFVRNGTRKCLVGHQACRPVRLSMSDGAECVHPLPDP